MFARWFVAPAVLAAVMMTAQETPVRPSGKVLHDAAGDIAENPGKIDTSLLPKLTHKHVRAAMTKVADWELAHSEDKFTQDWTYAPLYSGLLATSATTGDAKYHDAVLHAAEKFDWKLLQGRYDHADDEAIGQAYEALYLEKKDPKRIAALKENFAQVMARTRNPEKDLWWWCDALYMAPPGFAMMTKITGDRKYIDFMDKEWDLTTEHLYSPAEKLYFRDANYLHRTEKNGKPLFWSRGNGWVLAGTARVLSTMPKNDPLRPKYEKLFREMAARIAELQPADGLWRMGLLDPEAYDMGEVSGTGFFTYAMAWGVNNGLLDKKKFMPVIERAWSGMLKCVYEDGRLGSIQPIGAAPTSLRAGSSWVYGVGAFLLTGSELDKMATGHKAVKNQEKK
ncbi:MAG: glycoside hydrolase family 88 protein [Acidobacteria bacterium]|nr:glycoside hydrolase family 88 protein [Acidobacteriota bacterium]